MKKSNPAAIAIDKTKAHVTTIVDLAVHSTGGLVFVGKEIQPKRCSIPKQMNPSKKMNNKNTGGNPIVQPREQLLESVTEGDKQRPSFSEIFLRFARRSPVSNSLSRNVSTNPDTP